MKPILMSSVTFSFVIAACSFLLYFLPFILADGRLSGERTDICKIKAVHQGSLCSLLLLAYGTCSLLTDDYVRDRLMGVRLWK